MTGRVLKACVITAIMLGGCQSQFRAAPAPPPPMEPVEFAARLSSEIRPGDPADALPPQQLAIGECGLFLWTRQNPPQFIFFAGFGGSGARAIIDERVMELARVGAAPAGQMPLEQAYETATGRMVQVSLTVGEPIEGGIRIPAAAIRIAQPDGWELVSPAAGLTACRTE